MTSAQQQVLKRYKGSSTFWHMLRMSKQQNTDYIVVGKCGVSFLEVFDILTSSAFTIVNSSRGHFRAQSAGLTQSGRYSWRQPSRLSHQGKDASENVQKLQMSRSFCDRDQGKLEKETSIPIYFRNYAKSSPRSATSQLQILLRNCKGKPSIQVLCFSEAEMCKEKREMSRITTSSLSLIHI